MMRRYKGKLYYEDSNAHLEVTAFIIRPDGIGFSLTSVSDLGRWEAESGKTALLQPDGSYLVKSVKASERGTFASIPWDIVFRIESEEHGKLVEIVGSVWEGASEGRFEGELEAY